MRIFFDIEIGDLYARFQSTIHEHAPLVTIVTSWVGQMDLVVSNDEETLRQGLGARVLSYQLLCQRGEKPFEHLRKEFPATPFGVFCWSNCDWPGWDCPDLTKMAQRIAELDRSLRPAQAPTGSRRA